MAMWPSNRKLYVKDGQAKDKIEERKRQLLNSMLPVIVESLCDGDLLLEVEGP